MVKICVSIPATTTASTIEAIRSLQKPDMIELRLDYAEERLNLTKLRESTNAPLISTARLPSQGGRWIGGEGERQKLLLSAAHTGFDYVDAEMDSVSLNDLVGRLHEKRAIVIVSRHYLDHSPSLDEALTVHRGAKEASADVVKVVGMALSPADNLPCIEYLTKEPGNVSFAMGAHGMPSRVLSPLLGGAWTYASVTEGAEVAAGQLSLASLRKVYRIMGVQD